MMKNFPLRLVLSVAFLGSIIYLFDIFENDDKQIIEIQKLVIKIQQKSNDITVDVDKLEPNLEYEYMKDRASNDFDSDIQFLKEADEIVSNFGELELDPSNPEDKAIIEAFERSKTSLGINKSREIEDIFIPKVKSKDAFMVELACGISRNLARSEHPEDKLLAKDYLKTADYVMKKYNFTGDVCKYNFKYE